VDEARGWVQVSALALGLLGLGCSPMASTVPDASVSSDAGRADAGRVDRDAGLVDGGAPDGSVVEPEPDGGPTEPMSSTQVIAVEDFERYGSTAALKGSYGDQREVGGSLNLDPTQAAGGSKSLRIDYVTSAACTDADVMVGKVFFADVQTLMVRYRFRLTRGFRFQQPSAGCGSAGSSSTEFVLGRPQNGRGTVVLSVAEDAPVPVLLGALPQARWQVTIKDVRATTTPAQPSAIYRQHLRFSRLGPSAMADEQWHRLSLLVQRETSLGRGDGVLRVWVDGEAVLDYDGQVAGPAQAQVFTGTPVFGSFSYPTVLAPGASQAQSRWFDDVAIFEP
jgi:hypothetical protein